MTATSLSERSSGEAPHQAHEEGRQRFRHRSKTLSRSGDEARAAGAEDGNDVAWEQRLARRRRVDDDELTFAMGDTGATDKDSSENPKERLPTFRQRCRRSCGSTSPFASLASATSYLSPTSTVTTIASPASLKQ